MIYGLRKNYTIIIPSLVLSVYKDESVSKWKSFPFVYSIRFIHTTISIQRSSFPSLPSLSFYSLSFLTLKSNLLVFPELTLPLISGTLLSKHTDPIFIRYVLFTDVSITPSPIRHTTSLSSGRTDLTSHSSLSSSTTLISIIRLVHSRTPRIIPETESKTFYTLHESLDSGCMTDDYYGRGQ